MSDIKPCPFCGGNADIDGNPSDTQWLIYCTGCHQTVGTSILTKSKVVDKYNKRTLPWRKFDVDDETTWPDGEIFCIVAGGTIRGPNQVSVGEREWLKRANPSRRGFFSLITHWLPASELPLPRKE